MYTRPSLGCGRHYYPTLILLSLISFSAFSQVNTWTRPTSGNWEEPYWSLGTPPAFDHRVVINNPGWKAVQIDWNTVQTRPESLSVYSIAVTSPVDSFNTLLLNYAGFERPLTVNYSLTIGSNAALVLHSSALRIQTPTGVGLSIGGQVNQNDFSQVTGNQADVGWVGPGVYHLNSGLVQLQHLWLGGPSHGVFNQNGGSNSPGILHLETGGTYNLRDGDFSGTTYTADGSVFRQDGGHVHSLLEFHGGQYLFNRGFNYGGVRVPVYGAFREGNASAIQNGGTNYGPIYVGGEYRGDGSYVLSNGVVSAPLIELGLFGGFHQYGGTVTTPAAINLNHGFFDRGGIGGAAYGLVAGFLSSPGIAVDTSMFRQVGGTNQIAGHLEILARYGRGFTMYELTGGLLTAENTSVIGGVPHSEATGGFIQSGGTHRVANSLSVRGGNIPFSYSWRGYEMSGGQLIVSNLSLFPRAVLKQTGGTIVQSGTAMLNAANLLVGPGTQQFGALQLSATNSLTMPSNSCILRFRNSSALTWDATASLIIHNWSGSYLGGGSQQIIFGNSAAALSAAQVQQIFFQNPGGGLSPGLHPTKILPTGEIVPDSVPPTGRIPPRLAVRQTPSGIQITLSGEPGYNYGMIRSWDLAGWEMWTNGTATNGTWTVVDPVTWPSARFYRAVLMR